MGKEYNGKIAHAVLDDITDAYGWSFVAVPAQVNAGVTKKFYAKNNAEAESNVLIEKLCASIKADVYRLCIANGSSAYSKALISAADKMNAEELMEFKSTLEKEYRTKPASQLGGCEDNLNEFRMEAKR
jgi:hypothetical protein